MERAFWIELANFLIIRRAVFVKYTFFYARQSCHPFANGESIVENGER